MINLTILSSTTPKGLLKLTLYLGHKPMQSKVLPSIPIMRRELRQWVEFLQKHGLTVKYREDFL